MCIRYFNGVFQVALVVKKLPASAGDEGLIPGSGRSSKEYEMIICPVVFFFILPYIKEMTSASWMHEAGHSELVF